MSQPPVSWTPVERRGAAPATPAELTSRKLASRLAAVVQALQRLTAADLSLNALLDQIAEVAQLLIGAEGAEFELLDGEILAYHAGSGIAAGREGHQLPLDSSLSGEAIRLNQTLRCDDADTDPRVAASPARSPLVRSMLVAVVRAEGGPVGVLKVLSPLPSRFDDADAQTLELLAGSVGSLIHIRQGMERLSASEAQFRQLAENIEEVFHLTDLGQERIMYVGPAYERIWGRSRATLYAAPRSWLDAVHPDDHERVQQAALTWATTGGYHQEYRIIRPDGSIRWIRDRTFPVRDVNGVIYRVAGLAEDITERKLGVDLIAEQAALLDKARDAIHVRDADGRITYWNHGAERIYGWTAAEAVGALAVDLLRPEPAALQAASDRLLADGEWLGDLQAQSKDGRPLTVEARWTLVRDPDGQPLTILAIDTDVTEKQALEQQFLRAQRLESIGTLAGGIAHDLNNVLAPITMAIELLRTSITDPRDMELLDTMADSARRGAGMVRQVLQFARGISGTRVEVQPGQLIQEIETLLREMFPKNVEILTLIAPDLWNVLGDATQLHQVLINLCVNARDAMPEGGRITITAENIELTAEDIATSTGGRPGPHIAITVEDTGTGIAPEVMSRLFDPFFTTKAADKGTGLGLPTTLAIVKRHGGFIVVAGEPGQGARFRVYFPATAPSVGPETAPELKELPRGSGETILVVDDEASIRQITRQTLEAFGYRVLLARDGAAAVAMYAGHQAEIAVVIVDMLMPVMDGSATIRRLISMNPAVRIIAASGMDLNDDSARTAEGVAVQAFLPKPYTADAMLVALRAVLQPTA